MYFIMLGRNEKKYELISIFFAGLFFYKWNRKLNCEPMERIKKQTEVEKEKEKQLNAKN